MRTLVFDGVEIPEALLAQEVQNHPAPSAAEARAAAGHALAIRALLLQEGRNQGLAPVAEQDAQGREETPDEALVRAVLDNAVQVAPPTEAECRRVYDAEPGRFMTTPLSEASHILVEPRGTDEAAFDAAHAIARRLVGMLRDRQATFTELAHDWSDCPSSAAGGALGQLRPGDLAAEVEAALAALQPGEISEPVLSRFGWHVLRLERRIDPVRLPFEAVEPRIRRHLESRAWTAAAARYVADLAATARASGVALSIASDGEVREGCATLGDFLDAAGAAERLQPWLKAADPALAARLGEAAAAAGLSAETFVREAVAGFVAEADDERWTNLISTARDAEDPALACLATVLRSKLAPAKPAYTLIRRVAS
ncbi:MAG: peptidylprolyl isomerase [Caulobacteraceae bacterium]|nr:peptidylprolyl isomerase [Caulobacteraceae bacterium]